MRLFAIIAMLLLVSASHAQTEEAVIDSLRREIENNEGRDKLMAKLDLSHVMATVDWDECITMNDAVIREARALGAMDVEALAYYRNGYQYMRHNDLDLSGEYLKKALELYEILHDTAFIFEVYYDLALGQFRMGDLNASVSYYEKALALAECMDDVEAQMDVLGNMGAACFDQGRHSAALRCFERNLSLAQTCNDSLLLASCEANLAILYSQLGRWQQAKPIYEKVLPFFVRNEELYMAAVIYRNLGEIFTDHCVNYDTAMTCFSQAIALAEAIEMGDIWAESLNGMGAVHLAQGRYEQAKERYEEALSVAQSVHYTRGQIGALAGLSNLCLAMKSYSKSMEYAFQCLDLEQKAGLSLFATQVRASLVKDYARLGRFAEMDESFDALMDEHKELANRNVVLQEELDGLTQYYADMAQCYDEQETQLLESQRQMQRYRLAFFGLLAFVLLAGVGLACILKKSLPIHTKRQ